MTEKELANCFLFGGRVTYQGNHYHVLEVNHLNNTYTLDYPLVLLNAWANGETSSVVAEYEKKDEVLTAYNHCIVQGSLDKPLFLAIKQIKGW